MDTKTMRKILLAGCIAMPFAAQAEFDYTYLEGGYERQEIDGFDEAGDGLGVRGSLAVADNFHLLGGVHSTEFEVGPVDADFDAWELGIGYNRAIGPEVDFVGSLSYVGADLSFNDDELSVFDVDGDGYRADVGLRGRLAPAVELDGGIRYTDVDNGDETSAYVRGLFGTGSVRLLTEVEAGDDGEVYLIGGRFDF